MKRLLPLLMLIFTACQIPVPATKGKIGNAVSFALPKNMTAKDLEIDLITTGDFAKNSFMRNALPKIDYSAPASTNFIHFTFKASYITSRNDPKVINAAAAGEVDIVNAHYAGAEKIVRAGIDEGVKAAKKSVVP